MFYDWQWQLRSSIKSLDDLFLHVNFSSEEKMLMREEFAHAALPFSLTPYFASLMTGSIDCPILLQIISSKKELAFEKDAMRDPLGEEEREKTPHLVHRYPDRVLFLATDRCASYCRFCMRKRWVGQGPSPKKDDYDAAFDYISEHPEIKEIIFSGGDPLILSNERLKELLTRAFSIKHIDFVRIHSRILSFAPMRVDKDLCAIFKQFSPLYLVTHFNHPRELSDVAKESLKSLSEAGVLLLNQSVLLKGINDNADVLSELFYGLVKNRVKPYYMHQCDLIEGASHFRVPLKESLALMDSLRGKISGLCLPTLVIDIPGGHGKVPLLKNSIVKEDEKYVYLKGFKGAVAPYPKD
jgi:lysine 2,3-aminomutase